MSVDIENKIREILSSVRDTIDFTNTDVNADFGDAGLDSLDTATVLLEVQEAFNLRISDDDAEELTSIAKLSQYVASKTA